MYILALYAHASVFKANNNPLPRCLVSSAAPPPNRQAPLLGLLEGPASEHPWPHEPARSTGAQSKRRFAHDDMERLSSSHLVNTTLRICPMQTDARETWRSAKHLHCFFAHRSRSDPSACKFRQTPTMQPILQTLNQSVNQVHPSGHASLVHARSQAVGSG